MMHKAGVPIMAGSDFSDWAMVPGVDLHNELALLVEAGFTPLEALQTATLNPAKFLGKTDTYGTIQVGRAADLVLLDMNPLRGHQPHKEDQRRPTRREILSTGVNQSQGPARRRETMTTMRLTPTASFLMSSDRPLRSLTCSTE